jgi:hypothetical protein
VHSRISEYGGSHDEGIGMRMGHVPLEYSICHEQVVKQQLSKVELDIDMNDLVMEGSSATAAKAQTHE